MVERLQVKACSIGKILSNLEKRYHSNHDKDDANMKKSPSGQQLGHGPSKRSHVKIQMIPPFNASSIKKSPSAEPATSAVVAQDEEVKEPDFKEENIKEPDIKEENMEECSQQ